MYDSIYRRHLEQANSETESRIRGYQGQRGEGNGKIVFNWDRVAVWKVKKFWTWKVVMAAQHFACV